MNEFEEIFNSIYAEDHPGQPVPDAEPYNPYEAATLEDDNSQPSQAEDAYDNFRSNIKSEEDYFAAYDSHRAPAVRHEWDESSPYSAKVLPDISELSRDNSEDSVDDNIISEPSNIDDEFGSDLTMSDDEYDDKYDLEDIDDDFSIKSFGDFISSKIAGFIIKIRGGVPYDATTSTGEEDSDELGKEVPLLTGSKYYGSQIYSLRVRLMLSLAFAVILTYISLGLPMLGTMNNVAIATSTCLALQFSIMVFCLDVFTNGILNMFRGRLGADSLACISCFLTSIDGFMVLSGACDAHLPFCIISSLSLIGVLFSSFLTCRGIRKALRVPAISSRIYTVTGETGVTGKEITLLKSRRKLEGFVRRMEEEPIDEYIYRRISVILIILSVVLSIFIAFIKQDFSNFIFILTIIFSVSVPASALICYSLPFFIGTMKIFSQGAAIAGWSGLLDIGHSKNLIVTDSDLFPPDNVEIENVRIFADYDSNKVISYAASIIIKSKNGLQDSFENLLKENECELSRVDNFECLSGGGFSAMIEGKNVICGNSDLMKLMNIRIPSKLVSGTSVLLSIDGILYGIFKIKYKPNSKVRRALVSLMNSNRHPIFAIRDFNVTPEMIHDCFDVATDGYDFPPFTDRFPISEAKPAKESKVAGVICREGLGPLTALADTGRSLYVVAKTNTIISVFSAFLGMILAALFLLLGNSVTISLMLIYSVLSFLPILILGLIGVSSN